MQNHMAAVKRFSTHAKRNCACFTPDGVVYTKLKAKRNHKRSSIHRHKRDADDVNEDEARHSGIPSEIHYLLRLSRAIDDVRALILADQIADTQSRRKRETVDHITAVIQEIQGTLEQLEQTSAEESDTANVTEKIGAKCFVQSNGKVNCSEIIYEDERSWRKSRNQIDLLIQVLKSKIVELKGIKKHLKHNKPSNIEDDNSSSSEESAENVPTQKEATETLKETGNAHDSDVYSSTTVAKGLLSSTSTDFDRDSVARTSVTFNAPSTITTKSTKGPLINASRSGHRTRGYSIVHTGHHNGTGHHRRTTPITADTSITTTHRPPDHRRNLFRHSKHNVTHLTTKRQRTGTTATSSKPSTTIMSSLPTTVSSPAATSIDSLLRMDPAPEATTSAIEALITYIGSDNDHSSTTSANFEFSPTTESFTDDRSIDANGDNHGTLS